MTRDSGCRPGGALVLAGSNGAGKSTLLRLLAGLVRPAAGRVFSNDVDPPGDLAAHGQRVVYPGHQDAVKPGPTVAENVRFAATVSRRSVMTALAAAGWEGLAELPARMPSAGRKRRLGLSRLVLSVAAV